MPTYRAQHQFFGNGGGTQDLYCNQFYFFSTTHLPADAATWGPTLASSIHLLWVGGSPGNSLSRWYHNRCGGSSGLTKIYDVTGNPASAGPPIAVVPDSAMVGSGDYLFDMASSAGMPEEVALCLSYQAAHTDGDLPRRRGRIYLGPFNKLAVDDGADVGLPTRPAAGLKDALLNGADAMHTSLVADGWDWRVFSERDGFAFSIINVSVDDAFDTIRGRGTAPSMRTTITF